jgi:hypothetical protein
MRNVVNRNNRQLVLGGIGNERFDALMVHNMLISIGHHGPAAIPSPAPHDVDGVSEKRVRCANNGPNVQIVLPVLNRHVKQVSLGV